jgi:CelD/BcsL family acetyltransferase involved in cellulose biosynthesis
MAQSAGVEVVTLEGFDGLAEEWDALARRTGATPFSRPGWIRAWWSAFGSGELRLFTHRRDGELTAVLPLSRGRGGRLRGCSNVHTPVFDVAAPADDLRALLVAALRESGAGLVLDQLDSAGELATAARQLADEGACGLLRLDSRESSRVEATLSWEEYEQGLRSKRRSNTRRGMRRLGELGEVSFEVLDGGEARRLLSYAGPGRINSATGGGALEAFDDFLRLEASDWKVQRGTAVRQSPQTESFYKDLIAWAAEAGVLRLVFIRLDERPIAVQLTIESGTARYVLKIGFDGEFSRSAPGVIHYLEEIRTALEAGRALEMGTGEEPFKQELRTGTWTMESLGLFPRTLRGALSRQVAAGRMRVYGRARESKALQRGRDAVAGWRARGS